MSVRRLGIEIYPGTTVLLVVHSDVQEVDTCRRVIVCELDAGMERVQRLKNANVQSVQGLLQRSSYTHNLYH